MANSDIYNLELLSLVAKITQEITNYTGLNDKTLAEFVIALHERSNKSLPAFKQKLKEAGAEFPDSFVENVDRLILSMHPKHKQRHKSSTNGDAKGAAAEGELTEQEKKKRLFPGLALKDSEAKAPVADDVFLQEIGDLVSGRKVRDRPWEDDRESKRQRRESPRSPSPPRGRDYGSRDRRGGYGGRGALDDRPVLFKIYNGRVTGLKEFGAFVTLEGVAGRVEGVYASSKSIGYH